MDTETEPTEFEQDQMKLEALRLMRILMQEQMRESTDLISRHCWRYWSEQIGKEIEKLAYKPKRFRKDLFARRATRKG